jgi:hypothetical protein
VAVAVAMTMTMMVGVEPNLLAAETHLRVGLFDSQI